VNAMGQAGSTSARRQLGARLRELREQRGLSCAQAAAVIHCSDSKIRRLERGRLSFKRRDVRALLAFYQVTPPEWRQLLDLVLVANTPPWWRPTFNDVMPGWFHPYMELEAAARQIRTYETQVIPGLLQTCDYHRALIDARLLPCTPEDRDRRIELRRLRREALATSGAKLWAIVDEAALRRTIGDRHVMRAQLRHLCELADNPQIAIQVLPFRSGGFVADATGFTIVRLNDSAADTDVPDIVYIEYLTGALCLNSTKEVDAHNGLFTRLVIASPPPQETSILIEKIQSGS
jgi:transcriptional regulator with XRE-family HTH domain